MRLSAFILSNIEPILADWEAFARSIAPGARMNKLALRDHAEDILRATARDMESKQTAKQQSDKSRGEGRGGHESDGVDGASEVHAIGRVTSGFDLIEMVAEYRALRASVIRLWRASDPRPELRDLDDLTRFNESIDQSLMEAVRSYTDRVDRSRQMFLAILGHDLRNPLQSVMMSADVLAQNKQLDAESSTIASRISTSASAMARMISDLLDFTGGGLGGAMPISPAATDLKEVCQEIVEETRAAHPARTVHFEAHGNLDGQWDAARLRQLISNLLGNAVQHGDDSAPVELSITADGSDVRLVVSNDGPPIPSDALATIFDPLVRGASSDPKKERRPGSIGLGLYVAREVVNAHGGAIDVESSEKAGTAFTIHLPRRHPTSSDS